MIVPTMAQRLKLRERPTARCVMKQSWRELLFLHWKYDPEEIQRMLPAGLTMDTFEGSAWVGIVPFFMCNVRPSWGFSVPGLSNFLELNVRTYVYDENGVPGVWFFSLDANNSIAVAIARSVFHLPYHNAKMRARATPATVDYWSQRGTIPADHFVYQPVGEDRMAVPGSLDFFLVERYLLFSRQRKSNTISMGRVHHAPYHLREVKVIEHTAQLLAPNGLSAVDRIFDHAIYVRQVEVDIFPLEVGSQSKK